LILDEVPKQLVAGDTWRWTRSFDDYPAPTWTVTYYFENKAKQFSSAATADGTSQAVSIGATTSAGYPAGNYRWYARAVSGVIEETIADENGYLEVLPNPATVGARDLRTFAQRALEAVESAIEGKASSAQLSFSIGTRTVASYTIAELWQLRKDLQQEVRTQQAGAAAGLGRKLQIRVGRG
jgi:hypothetical protein